MSSVDPVHLRFDVFELDEPEARLTRNGVPVPLPPKAFAVLCALAREPARLVTKEALLDRAWGHQFVSESVLKTTISQLRTALGDDAKLPRYIETASRRGYRFIAGTGTAASPPPPTLPLMTLSHDAPVPAEAPAAPTLVGRQAALSRLHAAWGRANAGQRQVLWLAGEPGVGKTTLIDHFVASLRPAAWAPGQCVEQYGAGEPYMPMLEALAQLCRDDPAVPALLRAVAPTWLLQLPWLSDDAERQALRRELAGAGPDRMLRELGELFDRYTETRPLLLVTEDLHWCDRATLNLIDHVARRRSPARLMWLASFRIAEVIAEDHPLKALRHELRLHRLCDEIVLEPFSEQETAAFIAGRVPQARVSEVFVRALHARTDGLPLFVTNVVDELVAQGLLDADVDASQVDLQLGAMAIPENLAGIIERQLGKLPPEQREMLAAASVCGVEFRPVTVADALGRDKPWVDDCCQSLARQRRWLDEARLERLPDGRLDARYTFRHALYRHVLYGRLGTLARAQLHRRVGDSLQRLRAEGAPVTAAQLASQFELGHEPMAALQHYAEAAESALRHFAPAEAMDLVARAFDLLPQAAPSTARDALELALAALQGAGTAQLLGVSSPETKRAFERALALLDGMPQHPLRALVLHGLGLVLLTRGDYAEARALAERTQALAAAVGDRSLELSACSVLGQVHTLQGRHLEARACLERGVAACEELGDAALQAAFVVDPGVTLLATLSLPLLHLGLADQAQARFEQAQARARRLGEPMAQMVAAWFGALFKSRLQDLAAVAALADEMRTIVERNALAQGQAAHRWFRGWAVARQGAPRDGHREIRDAHERNLRLGMLSGISEVLGYAAEALLLAEDWAGAQAQLDQAMALVQRLSERVYLPQLLMLRGRMAIGQGRPTDGTAALREAVHEADRQGAPWLELLCRTALCEQAHPSLPDLDALAQLLSRLSEGAGTLPVARARAVLAAHRHPAPPAR